MHLVLIAAVLILVAILIIYSIYNWYTQRNLVSIVNDYEIYKVHSTYSNHTDAAKKLAELNAINIKFFRFLKNKYKINNLYGSDSLSLSETDPKFTYRRGLVSRILSSYNPEVIIENDPKTSTDTSYTVDKGKELHVCLRNRIDPMVIHNTDDISFVLLHEIAHMGNYTWGHDSNFWTVFKFVLTEAKEAGIHNPIDYSKKPITYCGLYVDYNPYYDNSLPII